MKSSLESEASVHTRHLAIEIQIAKPDWLKLKASLVYRNKPWNHFHEKKLHRGIYHHLEAVGDNYFH